MENRYLFRGKRIDNGEWVEGYLSYPFCTKKGNESYYFYAKDSLGFFCRCVVDASTICRCTGCEDMNGKLIFENDILHNGNYFVVKWNAPCARFDIVLNNSHNIPIGKWEPMILRNIENPLIMKLSATSLTTRNYWRCRHD